MHAHHAQHFDPSFDTDRSPFARGHHGHHGRHGSWDRSSGGFQGGRFLPFLAGAFLMRAALRHAYSQADAERPRQQGRGGRDPWGRGGWSAPHAHSGPDHEHGPGHDRDHGHGHNHDHGRGDGRGFGAPWQRGHRDAIRGLRPEIGGLVAILRDAFMRGGIDQRQVGEIRTVLADARTRIAAILAETQPITHV